MKISKLLLICLLLVIIPSYASAVTHDIIITDDEFSPSKIYITQGDTVRWTNQGSILHRVYCSGIFDSHDLNPGVSFEYTFTAMGTVTYTHIPDTSKTGTVEVLRKLLISPPSSSVLWYDQDFNIIVFPIGDDADRIQVSFNGSTLFDGDYPQFLTFIGFFKGANITGCCRLAIPFQSLNMPLGVNTLTVKLIYDDKVIHDNSVTAVYTVVGTQGVYP